MQIRVLLKIANLGDTKKTTNSGVANSYVANSATTEVANLDIANSATTEIANSDIANSAAIEIANSDIANSAATEIANSDIANSAATEIANSDIANSAATEIANSDIANSATTEIANSGGELAFPLGGELAFPLRGELVLPLGGELKPKLAQQIALDNELVAPENHHAIGKCNMRINPGMKPKEPTYQVALDALALTTCYPAFLITAKVPVIYMHQFWAIVSGKEFDEPPTEEEALSFIRKLGHSGEIRKKMFMHTARDDSVLGTMRFVSRHANTQVYGEILPKAMTNQALLDFVAYKTCHAIAIGSETPMPRKEVALSEAARIKEATKQSNKDFHILQASGSGDGNDFELEVSNEQHLKMTGANEGTGTILGVPNVPKYEFKSKRESWGNSGEEDEDDENDSEDNSDDGDDDDDDGNDRNDNDDDDDANDDDNQEGDDTYDDDKETDSNRTESDRIKIPVINQSTTKYYEEEEEKIDDEEMMDDEEDDEVTKEMYDDVNVNLGNEDTDMTNADQGSSDQQNKADEPLQSSSVSSDFTSKLLNLKNPSPADNEISLLMENSDRNATVYAQALSSIPAIVDRYIDNKLGEAINKAIQAYNLDCKQEALDEKNAYRRKANHILEQIKKKKLYDALVESYKIDKDLFNTYSEVFTLKRTRDNKDKDQDPSAGSDQGTKRRKSNKDAESSRDSRSKEKKSSSTSKDASNLNISLLASLLMQGIQVIQLMTRECNRIKSLTRIWISQVARAKEPRTLFDELMDTSFNFSAFVLNWLNIKDLTQEILVGPAFELLKGTCKSLTELEYHLEECSKATTERIDWHNPEGKQRIVIQRRAKDLQLGVKSYQKKLNLTKPDTFRSALNDIAKGIRMEYLPKRKWSGLDKRRARVMMQDIDQQLYERRLMRNLEKLVNGREYKNDLSQNQRDLPRDIPLDSVEVLSYEVSESAKGVKELKRKVKIKGEKKEALLTLKQKSGQYICCQESQR
ncbi:hypothetical protein Tco_0751571 [Tanacetum coccineum]|uniref:Uncharacterized protein n=1 Tax=Tanacetum coccineum TaxID=301880 RepID=A0ABQ4Z7I4_9ASTR